MSRMTWLPLLSSAYRGEAPDAVLPALEVVHPDPLTRQELPVFEPVPLARGLHSSTSQLNLSRF